MVPREECSGSCESHESSYVKLKSKIIGNKVCKCCSAATTVTEKIDMVCGSETVEAEYVRIKSCKCNQCGSIINNFD